MTHKSRTDVLTVIHYLGLIALLGIGGLIFLIHEQAATNEVGLLNGVIGAAIGALGALLASTSARVSPPPPSKENPVPVQPVTDPTNPVFVDDVSEDRPVGKQDVADQYSDRSANTVNEEEETEGE